MKVTLKGNIIKERYFYTTKFLSSSDALEELRNISILSDASDITIADLESIDDRTLPNVPDDVISDYETCTAEAPQKHLHSPVAT